MNQHWSFPVVALLLCLLLMSCADQLQQKTEFEKEREGIVMREVAHRVLQYAGDSTSKIPPVSRVTDYRFRISFESGFSFQPDSLVQVIRRTLSGNGLSSDYHVQVLESESRKVVFGYSISGTKQQDIIPCSGREQPLKLYCIDIHFKEPEQQGVQWGSLAIWLSGGCTAFAFFYWLRKKRKRGKPEAALAQMSDEKENGILLGKLVFNPEQLRLSSNGQHQSLTIKEAKVLGILAGAVNQLVDRNQLQKEVWEDEGVIVGRSLDMFISRLRKKLEADPEVKIVNVHGKGYKLEVPGNSGRSF